MVNVDVSITIFERSAKSKDRNNIVQNNSRGRQPYCRPELSVTASIVILHNDASQQPSSSFDYKGTQNSGTATPGSQQRYAVRLD